MPYVTSWTKIVMRSFELSGRKGPALSVEIVARDRKSQRGKARWEWCFATRAQREKLSQISLAMRMSNPTGKINVVLSFPQE